MEQLASWIGVVFKFGAGAGEDPFEMAKGLDTDLIPHIRTGSR